MTRSDATTLAGGLREIPKKGSKSIAQHLKKEIEKKPKSKPINPIAA